jgi:hypothetical protein
LRGFVCGIAGFSLILMSLAYIARKQWFGLSFFPLQEWLYMHVVLGTLSLVLIVAHSGFYLRNTVASLALLFLLLTVLSGVAGLIIFYYAPRAQTRHAAAVLMPDDLCQRLTRLHEELTELCSEKGGVFLQVYNQLVIPLYRTEAGQEAPPDADVTAWAERVPPEDAEDFVKLAVKVEMVHDLLVLLGRHMKFRWLIQGWLLVHIPATIGLVAFSLAHVIAITWLGVR